jgi:hypothetical protein
MEGFPAQRGAASADFDVLLFPPRGALNTESCRVFRSLPHCGHFTLVSDDSTIDSYRVLHAWQTYS